MATAVVKDSHLTYNGIKYFRGNATAVRLGSYGKKKQPVLSTNYLEVDDHLDVNETIDPAVVADIDTTSSSSADVTLNLKVLNVGGGSVSGTFTNFQQKKLKLVQFCLTLSEVEKLVNAANAENDLDDYKKTARVAHQIWVVMEAEEASKFTGSVSLKAQAVVNGVKITATGTGSNTTVTSVTISAGSTYAYLLAKPKWDGNNIEDWTTDQWSLS